MGKNGADKPLVFVSYSKFDRAWLDKYLLVHLGGLEKAGLISAWSDSDIDKSGEWLLPLVKAMADANVAICLISPNYLNTEFCLKHEIPFLIERAEKDGLHLLMFLIDECAWQAQPWLAKRQLFLPKGQSVVIDFKGKENRPFTWLTTHINELLGDRIEAPDKLPISDTIRKASLPSVPMQQRSLMSSRCRSPRRRRPLTPPPRPSHRHRTPPRHRRGTVRPAGRTTDAR